MLKVYRKHDIPAAPGFHKWPAIGSVMLKINQGKAEPGSFFKSRRSSEPGLLAFCIHEV